MSTVRVVVQVLVVAVVAAAVRGSLDQRQSDASVSVVRGVQTKDERGNIPLRREVRELKDSSPEQWSLYLLGLEALQAADQKDPLSFYGLASIHGRPFRVWGNAPGLTHKLGTSGYCPHNNVLFSGWHRPYLALFEEVLHRHIGRIASEATGDRAGAVKAAAQSFRMPYWDWARGDNGGSVPDFFLRREIDLTHPNGTKIVIRNPLYSYTFHPLTSDEFDGKWQFIDHTIRWPDSEGRNPTSQPEEFIKDFNLQRRSLSDHIDLAFRQDTMNDFVRVMEEAHGWMHGVIGGGYKDNKPTGHFWPLEYSAFEPLFMLHHVNCDRILALYQAAHPDRFFTPSNIRDNGNVFLEDYQIVDADTQLLPFRNTSGSFWTTRNARDVETFGYRYSEMQSQSAASAAIAQLYSNSARDALGPAQSGADKSSVLADDGSYTDWAISTKVALKHAPQSFVVRFSFGNGMSEKIKDVGSWVRLKHIAHGDADKPIDPVSDLDQDLQSSISLTSDLLDEVAAGTLQSLDPKHVVPFLKGKLAWKVVDGHTGNIMEDSQRAFTFEVISTKAHIPKDANSPIAYSKDISKHPEVTMGRTGGGSS